MNDYEYSDKMEHALQYLKDRYGEEGLQYRSVLDLCCGAGCFMRCIISSRNASF